MTNKQEFKIEDFFALPVRLYTHRCSRCDAIGRVQPRKPNGENLLPVTASDGAGHFFCDRCLDELAMADFEGLMEKIPEKLFKATFDSEEFRAVPPTQCSRCPNDNAIWTSRPKLGDQGFDLCDSCRHSLFFAGIRGSLRILYQN